MKIYTGLSPSPDEPINEPSARLRRKDWNDGGFGTTFELDVLVDNRWRRIGVVKVARRGMRRGSVAADGEHEASYTPLPPSPFSHLPSDYFSLGADADYYENLARHLGPDGARALLNALRDIAVSAIDVSSIANEEALSESVMSTTSVTAFARFRRLLDGDRRKGSFQLSYSLDESHDSSSTIHFEVDRSRHLPTNVHVLIGSNGAGKTTALTNIRWAFEENTLSIKGDPLSPGAQEGIGGLLSISFSAFDTFPDQERDRNTQLQARSTNIRLPRPSHAKANTNRKEATRERETEIGEYVRNEVLGCLAERPERLISALKIVAEADAVLSYHAVNTSRGLRKLNFAALSSGHKISLLVVASIVRYAEEGTLVLLDEPESHLHPPLLSALTRCLSHLMTEVNGLAIVATHSAVVLQEVPRRCAWIMWKSSTGYRAQNPEIETFGANISVLNREVFDLELQRSGYHSLLSEVATKARNYEDALSQLDGEIGDEAKMLLSSMTRRRTGNR